jgi:hypothetical protein
MSADREFKILITSDADSFLKGTNQSGGAIQRLRDQIATANKDIAAGVKTYSTAEAEAAAASVEATDKTFASKKQLKAAVKGLREEFPVLAHVAKLALNPITFIVAGVGAAFALWTRRIEEATRTLAGMELPDISDAHIAKVKSAATAYQQLSEAVAKSAEAYNSVSAAADRESKATAASLDQRKKQLASEKDLALAKLEAARGSMSDAEYQRRRMGIEDTFAQAGVKISEEERRKALEEKSRRIANLGISASADVRSAQARHPGSAEDEAAIEAELKAQYEKAKKAKEEALARMAEIQDARNSPLENIRGAYTRYLRYGFKTGSEAMSLEEQNVQRAEAAMGPYQNFLRTKEGREADRKFVSSRMESASGKISEAFRLEQEFPGDQSAARLADRSDRQVAANESRSRMYRGIGEADSQIKRLNEEMAKAIESGAGNISALVQFAREWATEMDRLKQAVKELRIR